MTETASDGREWCKTPQMCSAALKEQMPCGTCREDARRYEAALVRYHQQIAKEAHT